MLKEEARSLVLEILMQEVDVDYLEGRAIHRWLIFLAAHKDFVSGLIYNSVR